MPFLTREWLKGVFYFQGLKNISIDSAEAVRNIEVKKSVFP